MARAEWRPAGLRRAAATTTLTLLAAALAGCGLFRGGSPDNEPTLRTLANRTVPVQTDGALPKASEEQAIAAYQQFLAVAPNARERGEALRRMGDLEMERAEKRAADGTLPPLAATAPASGAASVPAPVPGAPDFRIAIARYQQVLREDAKNPNNDRVLYQLARAQEQGGDLDGALVTLNRLVAGYPKSPYLEETQFRRGELLFTARKYGESEQAFATVLAKGTASAYHERSLYMHGWTLYKQGRLDEALASFFGVLDRKLGTLPPDAEPDKVLSRADRELVEDTFRVTSISLENLKGAESIEGYVGVADKPQRKVYEHRVWDQLGELYLRQERPKDAADTYAAFARTHPLHAQAPVLQARVIEIYEKAGFGEQALAAKRAFVASYGRQSAFRQANPAGWQKAQPLVKTHLAELARHHHALAQQNKARGTGKADAEAAIGWYRELIVAFPDDKAAPQQNFLLAELLYDERRWPEAATEYEKTAYGYARHEKAADAGYAALLAYAKQGEQAGTAEKPALQKQSIASAVRFADAFTTDPRRGPVLADATDKSWALGDAAQAAALARRVVALDPPAGEKERRVAYTVLGHASFDGARYADAEAAYGEALKLVPARDAGRGELVERQAAAVYKQGEQARAQGNARDAVAAFTRVASVAPDSPIRANAQYDAAASLIAMKDWDSAATTLEDFRRRYPNHPLQAETAAKLAVAYEQQQQWPRAAAEYERLAAQAGDAKVAQGAQWQAAEYYEKGQARAQARAAYERYVQRFPQPLEPAIEARQRLALIARAENQPARELALRKEILQADAQGGAARTDRTRRLGAEAALALAEPAAEQYRRVALVEPLQQALRVKKARMEEALQAYNAAADYGVAEVTTEATFRIAGIYRDFGKSLMASERPKRLSKVEREQYDVLLEEQAYPFEEKSIELHELNTRRAAKGIWDRWVQESYAALRELRPVRYGKAEVTEGVVDAIR